MALSSGATLSLVGTGLPLMSRWKMLREVAKRLSDRQVDIEVTEAAKGELVKAGYDRVYGARPLKRTIQRRIENPLAKRILSGEFAEGDVIRVDYDGEEFRFEKAEHREAAPEPEKEPVAV